MRGFPMSRRPRAIPPIIPLALILACAGGSRSSGQEGSPGALSPDSPGAMLANPHPTFLAHVALEPASGVLREGETFAVRFQAERDAFLYLLYHQADGRALLLFPNPARPD